MRASGTTEAAALRGPPAQPGLTSVLAIVPAFESGDDGVVGRVDDRDVRVASVPVQDVDVDGHDRSGLVGIDVRIVWTRVTRKRLGEDGESATLRPSHLEATGRAHQRSVARCTGSTRTREWTTWYRPWCSRREDG